MADQTEIRGLYRIFFHLIGEHDRFIRGDTLARRTFEELQHRFPPFDHRDHFLSLLPGKSGDNGGFGNHFIYLPPPGDIAQTSILVVYASWSLRDDTTLLRDTFRLHVGVFAPRADDDGGGLGFWGYRFETPEGPGDHDYWHAQPIDRFAVGDDPVVGAARWHSTHCPAFPLPARDLVQLVACAYVSFCGVPGRERVLEILGTEPAAAGVRDIPLPGSDGNGA